MYSHAKVALDVSLGLPHLGYPNILVEDSLVADTAGYLFSVKVLQESLSVLPTGREDHAIAYLHHLVLLNEQIEQVRFVGEVPERIQDILVDPQTSGGLLISMGSRKAELLLDRLWQAGVEDAVIIGEVVSEPKGVVTIK